MLLIYHIASINTRTIENGLIYLKASVITVTVVFRQIGATPMRNCTVSAIAAVRLLAGCIAFTAYIGGIAGIVFIIGGAA